MTPLKLIVVLCVEEHAALLRKRFRQLQLPVFSQASLEGFPAPPSASAGWFAAEPLPVDAKMFMLFGTEAQARQMLEAIGQLNEKLGSNPAHAYVLPVEQYTPAFA